jgi:hypothetical protein
MGSFVISMFRQDRTERGFVVLEDSNLYGCTLEGESRIFLLWDNG